MRLVGQFSRLMLISLRMIGKYIRKVVLVSDLKIDFSLLMIIMNRIRNDLLMLKVLLIFIVLRQIVKNSVLDRLIKNDDIVKVVSFVVNGFILMIFVVIFMLWIVIYLWLVGLCVRFCVISVFSVRKIRYIRQVVYVGELGLVIVILIMVCLGVLI